jgi:arylsulfatase A-like enzyme
MITMVDDGVGRILRKLEELGLRENTIVVYTSDHGDVMGDHGIMLKHGLHSEGVIRVPFIWSDISFAQGIRSDVLSSAIDFTPSVLNRAGLAPYSGIQGENIISTVTTGSSLPRSGLIIEADELPENVDTKKFFRVRTYVDERWRLTLWVDDDFGEIYDRKNDPLELNNLWNNPSAKEDKACLIEAMLKQQYKYSDLMPQPKYMG